LTIHTVAFSAFFSVSLGRVDGFDQNETAGERDESGVVLGSFFTSQGDALEAFELAHGLLDPSAALIEGLGKEGGAVFGIGAVWDNRADVPLPRGLTVRLCVVSLVGQRRPGRDIRPDIEQDFELPAVAGFAPSQMDGKGQAIKVGLEVDLRRESAARATERLTVLPPLAPAAETCARTTVLSNICTRCAVGLICANAWKNASNTPDRLSRQKRFQTLFQPPNSVGSARQVMLWTVK
jgi:hypothetical protein